MNKRILGLVLILCLGLVAGAVGAQTTGFRLPWWGFSQAGTGAEPLTSASFQMQASVGQPGPLGSASSESFGVSGGFQTGAGAPCTLTADFDTDGDVDIVDIMEVVRRWGASVGDLLYDDPKYDLDDSGTIDVGDIMAAATEWRRSC